MSDDFVEPFAFIAEWDEFEAASCGGSASFMLTREDESVYVGDVTVPMEVLPVEGRHERTKLRVELTVTEHHPDVETRVSRQRSRWPVALEVLGFHDWMELGVDDVDTNERVTLMHISDLPETLLSETGDRCYAVFDLEYVADREPNESADRATGEVDLRWTADCGRTPSRPAVGAEVVCVGTPTGLQAIDVQSGRPRWHFDGLEPVLSQPLRPTIDSGTVYVGDREGRVWAIDTGTGTRQWRTATDEGILAAPTVGTVPSREGSGSKRTVFVGTVDGGVYALDASDGSIRWQTAIESGASPLQPRNSIVLSPVLAGERLYVSGLDGRLTVLDAATGDAQGVLYDPDPTSLEWGVPATPGVAGDTVYYNGHPSLQAFDATTGAERWADPPVVRPLVFHAPVRVDDTVIAGTHSKTLWAAKPNGPLVGIDAETGEIQWETEAYSSELSVVGETVYTTAGETATAFDPVTGEVLWRYPTGAGQLTATSEGIYAVGDDEDGTATLYALDEGDET